MKNLTERMKKIVKMTPESDTVADIGADHALVSIELYKSGKAKKVYACDINEGPVGLAKRNIAEAGAKGVTALLSDGLNAVYDKADTVIIAGMGGELIAGILEKYPLEKIKNFVLQPMNRADKLREALLRLRLKIDDECLVSDMGRIYAVIRASHGEMELSRAEVLSGPVIIKKRGELFPRYLDRIIRYEESKTKSAEDGKVHEENVSALKKLKE